MLTMKYLGHISENFGASGIQSSVFLINYQQRIYYANEALSTVTTL